MHSFGNGENEADIDYYYCYNNNYYYHTEPSLPLCRLACGRRLPHFFRSNRRMVERQSPEIEVSEVTSDNIVRMMLAVEDHWDHVDAYVEGVLKDKRNPRYTHRRI